jgi:hypothetical protein
MIAWTLLALVVGAGAAEADPSAVPAQTECNSCTARHKALQRLQEDRRRAPPKKDDEQPAPSGHSTPTATEATTPQE